jgi:hypothetical protein
LACSESPPPNRQKGVTYNIANVPPETLAQGLCLRSPPTSETGDEELAGPGSPYWPHFECHRLAVSARVTLYV